MPIVSGGEPTTRNDLVEICEIMLDKLPRLRKFGINTTGLTPQRGIPMLTKIAEMCHERGVIFSTRVSIDGVGDMHNQVRKVKRGFDKAQRNHPRDARTAEARALQLRHLDDDLLDEPRRRRQHPEVGARARTSTSSSTWCGSPSRCWATRNCRTTCKPVGAEEEQMRQFFMDRVRMDPLLDGQNYIYMHYADMISNGYHRHAPCPFQTQGIMLNPNGDLFFCENSEVVGNVLKRRRRRHLLPHVASQEHRESIRDDKCPTCLSPCQMNVSAVKQVVPYVKFLYRASKEKRRKLPAAARTGPDSLQPSR